LGSAKLHKPYHMIAGYAKMSGYTLEQLAEQLKIKRRTLDNKIKGRSDFSVQQAQILKKLLGRTNDEIFLQD
jgi:plasmid maintenance system antidote protein VapI